MQIRWRDIIDEINGTLGSYLLCVSGGVDSMFMLDFFHRKCRSPIRVVHFNHHLRATSGDEEALVERWCRENKIECLIGHGDPDAMRAATSLEAEARRQRYKFIDAHAFASDRVVTAHHADDQVETVLLRLMRGYPDTELRMQKIYENRYKPFLGVPKAAIIEQASHRGLKWIEDESNTDTVHERNWVRHVLVPQMMERRNVLKTIGLQQSFGDGTDRFAEANLDDEPEVNRSPNP